MKLLLQGENDTIQNKLLTSSQAWEPSTLLACQDSASVCWLLSSPPLRVQGWHDLFWRRYCREIKLGILSALMTPHHKSPNVFICDVVIPQTNRKKVCLKWLTEFRAKVRLQSNFPATGFWPLHSTNYLHRKGLSPPEPSRIWKKENTYLRCFALVYSCSLVTSSITS